VEKHPDSTDLRHVLATIYTSAGEPALAEEQLRKIVQLRPQELSHRVQLALLYVREKKNAEAEAVMREATTAMPKNNDAKMAYVEFLSSQVSPERAQQALQQFIAKDSRNYDLQLGLGALQQRTGDVDKAIATYNKIVEL